MNPFECLFLKSVTTYIGFIPAFSAKVNGMISRASAKARTIIEFISLRVLENSYNYIANSISGAPPPGIKPLFFTRDLTTHKAS